MAAVLLTDSDHTSIMMNLFYISGSLFFCVSVGALIGIYNKLCQIEKHLYVIAGRNGDSSLELSNKNEQSENAR